MPHAPAARTETVIEAGRDRWRPYLRELWNARSLLLFLAWKDLKVQFAQTSLGAGWLVLRPIIHVVALSLIFGRLARLPSDGVPYPLFALAGLVPWLYFSGSTGRAASSLSANLALVTKVYFPRMLLPMSQQLAALVSLIVMLAMCLAFAALYYGRPWPSQLLLLTAPLALLLMTTVGAGLWVSALCVNFPDVRQIVPTFLQLLMFATPVIWPWSLLPQSLGESGTRLLEGYAYYPMVGIVEGFRAILLDQADLPWDLMQRSAITALAVLLSGAWYFRRHERAFADVI